MSTSYFVFLFIFVLQGGVILTEEGPPKPKWLMLSAKFMHFIALPMDLSNIGKEKWRMETNTCDNIYFNGTRYVQNNRDKARMLLFDAAGKVAGVQMAFSNRLGVARNMVGGPFYDDGENYLLSVYFTDPNEVCNIQNKRPKGVVGDELYLQTGLYEYMKIPLLEKDLSSTNWVKGKCFFGMGQHYWYNIRAEMDCDDFFPYFLLYHNGKLNGFGFALTDYIKSKYIEYIPKGMCGSLFDKETLPECLLRLGKRLTVQHFYLEKEPASIRC